MSDLLHRQIFFLHKFRDGEGLIIAWRSGCQPCRTATEGSKKDFVGRPGDVRDDEILAGTQIAGFEATRRSKTSHTDDGWERFTVDGNLERPQAITNKQLISRVSEDF